MTAAVNKVLCWTLAMIALVFGEDARAADSLTTPRETGDTKASSDVPAATPLRSGWTGFYVGAHAGVSGGSSAWSATQPGGPDVSGSLNFFAPYDVFNGHGSHFAGLSADNRRAVIQAYVFPLVSWIWIGFWVLAFGTIVCLVPNKVRLSYARTQVVGVAEKHAAIEN